MQLTRSLPLIAALLSLSGSAACVRPTGPATGAALAKSLPAATKAIDDYLAWLQRTQTEVIASCAPTAAPKACARDKVAVLRASQLEALRAIKATAQPAREAVAELLGAAEAARPPAVTLSIGTARGALTASPPEPPAAPPCTPITINRELRPGETICPILGPAIQPPPLAAPPPPRAITPAPAGPAMSGPGPTLTPAPVAPGGGGQ